MLMIYNYLIVILLLFLSGVFSGLTLGLFSLNTDDLMRKSKLGNKKAKNVLKIRKMGNVLLCTLLIGNVAVNSAMAVFLGSITQGVIAGVVATVLIVIFGEILPQAVFARFALIVGAKTSWLVWVFIFVLYPVTYPLGWILDKVLGEELPTIWSKKEIAEIIKSHEDSPHSTIDGDEEKIMLGALSFSDKKARDVMTPRPVVYLKEETEILDEQLLNEIKGKGFSRIPIFSKTSDNIKGILFVKDLIVYDMREKSKIKEYMIEKNLLFIKDSMLLDKLFNVFLLKKIHMAFVFDEFGNFIGIVTLEDVIEEILSREIVDENDFTDDMQEFAMRFTHKDLME